jgi:hypothetical protein
VGSHNIEIGDQTNRVAKLVLQQSNQSCRGERSELEIATEPFNGENKRPEAKG